MTLYPRPIFGAGNRPPGLIFFLAGDPPPPFFTFDNECSADEHVTLCESLAQ